MTAQQLKNSILQMAVQGKLVPQDPNDEPASVLLERIKAEKEALIKSGKIKKSKKSSEIFRGASRTLPYAFCEQIGKEIRDISDEIPFEIPESWEWVKHNSIFELSGGSQPPKSMFKSEKQDGYIRLYQIRDYGKKPVPVYIPIETASKISQKGDILLARYGASLGKVFWAEYGAYNVALAKVIPLFNIKTINIEFLFLYYHSSIYKNIIFKNSRSAQAGFNKDDLENLYFPLPPIQEQARIVDAYKKLLPFIEKYEQAETKLTALNKSFPEMLKKSILQEAVQGKLVPQNPDDEPASILLERIRAEKQELIRQGKIKKSKHESIIVTRDKIPYEIINGKERCIADEVPFEIPESWCWVRLGYISTYAQVKKKINANYADKSLWQLDLEDIEKGGRLINRRTVGDVKAKGDKTSFDKGDILYSKLRPYLLKILIADDNGICTPEIVPFKLFGNILPEYIVFLLKSPYIDSLVNSETYGMKMPRVGTDTMTSIFVPLPPLFEQKRIVEKINELMPIINSISK